MLFDDICVCMSSYHSMNTKRKARVKRGACNDIDDLNEWHVLDHA